MCNIWILKLLNAAPNTGAALMVLYVSYLLGLSAVSSPITTITRSRWCTPG